MAEPRNSADQSLLAHYGTCIASYEGEGIVTLQEGHDVPCRFEAGQLSSGTVLLLCDFRSPLPFLQSVVNTGKLPVEAFQGTTSQGHRIRTNAILVELNYLPDPPMRTSFGAWAAYHLREMTVQILDCQEAQTVRFGVTNLKLFDAISSVNLECADHTARVGTEPVDQYGRVMRRLGALKGIEVTCEVVADLPSNVSIQCLENVVGSLCHILSVGRGTKIQWIYRDLYNAAGECVSRMHCSRVTKQYCPLPAIDPRNEVDTKAFIENTYRTYVEKREPYRLDRGTIDLYLDAKAETDYLETRGVKLAVAMEALKTAYLLQGQSFGPNQTSFRDVLKKLCIEIGLNVPDADIKLFVACRNCLVHRGRFYCQTATQEERAQCEPLSSPTHEYLFLLHFLDRVFLRLLGYGGAYIDWSAPGVPVRRDRI